MQSARSRQRTPVRGARVEWCRWSQGFGVGYAEKAPSENV